MRLYASAYERIRENAKIQKPNFKNQISKSIRGVQGVRTRKNRLKFCGKTRGNVENSVENMCKTNLQRKELPGATNTGQLRGGTQYRKCVQVGHAVIPPPMILKIKEDFKYESEDKGRI